MSGLEIRQKKGRKHKVQQFKIVQAKSGHIILKCTNFPEQQEEQPQEVLVNLPTVDEPNKELEVPQGIQRLF